MSGKLVEHAVVVSLTERVSAGCSPRHDGGEEQWQEPECTQPAQVISRRVTRFVPAAASASV